MAVQGARYSSSSCGVVTRSRNCRTKFDGSRPYPFGRRTFQVKRRFFETGAFQVARQENGSEARTEK